ncbi:GTP-binding protein HflX [Austwickia chelonae]|uniref:GTPase HflX n=1 Tax=Austwickia chelonae NBRC 105200 TaxID=1184607 RepID=K6VPN3_9MICO|nr:GTPase HflX [Austwickia chelonae]GAB77335.1 GTP-binding protein HflX [Austwickia chelonae NBRC 105200]SEW08057.1 GTP-binding protein HflX [Austwickia chelonae]
MTRPEDIFSTRASALADNDDWHRDDPDFVSYDGDQLEREERAAMRRVGGLSTELEDVTEVEYRELRLEKVVLAGVWSAGTVEDAENSLRELAALAETAGSQVMAGVLQRRQRPDAATFLGSGKAEELRDVVVNEGADTVVCDAELSPSQRRALEDIVKVKVIDRTALILDIFAQHAKSREGKAQVELAQLQYLLPRLRGWGESMSRQAGGQAAGGMGMGSRGPGETKIELDRRRINSRMAKLRREIRHMKTTRDVKRGARRENQVPAVVLAGYTNAGKSSLLNRLTGAGVLVENALFATLDPTVRKAVTPDGRPYTLSDTVGFVRSLPHQLVEAFRSTLEEVAEADVLLHVVDGSHPDPFAQISAVREVLAEVMSSGAEGARLGSTEETDALAKDAWSSDPRDRAARKEGADVRTGPREIVVVNKADLADPEILQQLVRRERDCLVVSARTGECMDALIARIATEIPRPHIDLTVLIPYDRGALVHRIHEEADVLSEEHTAEGTRLQVRVLPDLAGELSGFVSGGL